MFNAIFLTRQDKAIHAELASLDEAQLPAGDVDVRVEYSTLNYKDALAVTGRGAIIRKWPAIPGIDLAGVIEKSRDPAWQEGERIVVTGW
jgi:acrylyl-CoA reductase (NADPH)